MNYHALLAHFPKITYTRYKKLINFFKNLEDLWQAEFVDIVKAGIEESIVDEFISWKNKIDPEKIFAKLEEEKITVISITSSLYPELLLRIPDPPHSLFVRGKLPSPLLPTIAVVGTRHFTNYGKQVCEDLVSNLSRQGIGIVSGLALGIDGIAHETTLQSQGITLAVLGSGINNEQIYPSFHKNLAKRIIEEGGALISEYPPGFSPTRYSFPARNRIIAGLTLGTLVIEAPEESGSLITAKHALDYNREVMAIPQPITSTQGKGVNNLLKLGATMVTNFQDVIEALNLKNIKQIIENRHILPSSSLEELLLRVLSKEPKHVDMIIKETNLDSQTINSNLVLMEIKGMIKNIGGLQYIIK